MKEVLYFDSRHSFSWNDPVFLIFFKYKPPLLGIDQRNVTILLHSRHQTGQYRLLQRPSRPPLPPE